MILGTCGFGNTGASAVLDYFRGYTNIDIFDRFEFQLLHQADGINDLKYHLTQSCERIACNAAISRFIRLQKKGAFGNNIRKIIGNKYDEWVLEYISELLLCEWMGESSTYDPIDISSFSRNRIIRFAERSINYLLRKVNMKWHCPKYRKKYFSMMTEMEFDQITKKHLKKLLSLLNFSEHNLIVVDMLFSSTNPEHGMEFFDDAKAIIVNRDPRDVYVSAKLHPEDSRFMPNDSVEKFIVYYRTMQRFLETSSNVMIVQYEDLIYKYFETTNAIKQFLQLKDIPENEFVYFDPTYSVRYTKRQNLYDKYPDDVKMIEKKLQEYLYDFENAQSPSEDKNICVRKDSVEYKGWNLK